MRLCSGLLLLSAVLLPAPARAQAWLPPDGEAIVTLTYQGLFSDTHLDRNGRRFSPARISSNTLLLGIDYGLSERLALDVKVAWVANKYEGSDLLHGPVDTGIYHAALQDARLALRYRLRPHRKLALTPSLAVTIPTHAYETRGHSAPGRRLRSLQLGLSLGRDFPLGSAGLYVQGQYGYSFVERVEGLNIDRSNADIELGYPVTARLTVLATAAAQWTHGGLRFPLPRDEHFLTLFHFHDRAAKAQIVLFTSGATYGLNRTLDLYATAVWTLSGRNTHAVKGISLGMGWSFGQALSLSQGRGDPGGGSARPDRPARRRERPRLRGRSPNERSLESCDKGRSADGRASGSPSPGGNGGVRLTLQPPS